MGAWRVDDVMTTDVVSVRPETPYREIVDALTGRHVNAVPVTDNFDRVLGIVSEADLLHKVELIGEAHKRRVFDSHRRKEAKIKADAMYAGDLMTAPPVTVYGSTSIAEAARRMDREHVSSLPVLDSLGRLTGIVSRGDLLKVHLRSDADIRHDIVVEIFGRVFGVPDTAVDVEITEGAVRVAGSLDNPNAVDIALRLIANVSGVVSVDNGLVAAEGDAGGSGLPVAVA